MEGKPITDYVNAANSAGIKKAYKFVPKGGESSGAVRDRAKEFLKVAFLIVLLLYSNEMTDNRSKLAPKLASINCMIDPDNEHGLSFKQC